MSNSTPPNANGNSVTNHGRITKYVDAEGAFRVVVVEATGAVQEMKRIQDTLPIATVLVGRSMVAATLMASHLKSGEMVSLYFRGDGPIGMVFAESTYEGGVRGYTEQPHVSFPVSADTNSLGTALGKGQLSVVRTHAEGSRPYRGVVALVSGEIGEDVAHYLHQSQQIRSVVSVGVGITQNGDVGSAGGILIELFPGAQDDVITAIEAALKAAQPVSVAIQNGITGLDLAKMYVPNFNLTQLEHPETLTYSCRCTQERLVRSLALLPVSDLDDIIKNQKALDAKCEFCGRKYTLDHTEAIAVRAKVYKTSLN
jgi:molecular chaperone Hsp33